MGKLNLDLALINRGKSGAREIAWSVQEFIDLHSTASVERCIARLFGIDGVDDEGTPIPNIVVDSIKKSGGMENGVAFYIANAVINKNMPPQEIAEGIMLGDIDITRERINDFDLIMEKAFELSMANINRIVENRKRREEMIEEIGEGKKPYIYVIVATGNIYEDVLQAKSAARQGADIIAVIRTTGQSLLDYVPYGATVEGFGGTYATQENFKIMRRALDEVSLELGRYIRLCNYCSGLCMSEIAAIGAMERLDVMLNDALYGILFRDINMKRTFIDQFFSRLINGFAGVIINTGEDNYLTTSDAVENAHVVLASQLLNQEFALLAGLKEEQLGLGHAFEMDPSIENGFLLEIAQAQMAREIFPKAPLKYMPPTKFMTGNIFKGHIQDALFNVASILTNQGIHLLGMMTEEIHTPFMSERALSIENAKYVFNNMRNLGEEIEFKEDGIIKRRADEVLRKAVDFLEEIKNDGLFNSIEAGKFAGVKRKVNGGKGLDGVFRKGEYYINPFMDIMLGGSDL